MAPTVAGVSTTATWAGAAGMPYSVSWPGASSGRLIILPIFARTASTTIGLVSGYTLKSTDNATTTAATGEIQVKVAGSSESAPSVSSGILDTQPTGAIAIVVDGWSGTLTDVVVTQDVGSSASPVCPAGTAPVDGCLVLRGVFVTDDNLASSGLTVVFTPELTLQGSDASMGWWSETANTGAIGTATLPLGSGADPWMTFTIVIPPTIAGSPTNAPATVATGTGTANNAAGSVKPPAGTTGTGTAHNASTLIGAAATHATAVAAALAPSLSVRVSAQCATGTGTAYPAVFTIPSHPAGPRITATSPRGRISTSTTPPITSTSPRGWL